MKAKTEPESVTVVSGNPSTLREHPMLTSFLCKHVVPLGPEPRRCPCSSHALLLRGREFKIPKTRVRKNGGLGTADISGMKILDQVLVFRNPEFTYSVPLGFSNRGIQKGVWDT